MRRAVYVAFALVTLSQAAAPIRAAEDSPDGAKARVYVYRYKQFAGKALRPSIHVDERDIARVQNGRYVVMALSPGTHSFRSNDQQSKIELDVKAGREYYIRIDLAAGVWKGHGRLTLVQPEQGKGEVSQMKPADAEMIKDGSSLAPDFLGAK